MALETIGTEIIGVPPWPRRNASRSCSTSRGSCRERPDCVPFPFTSTTLRKTKLMVRPRRYASSERSCRTRAIRSANDSADPAPIAKVLAIENTCLRRLST